MPTTPTSIVNRLMGVEAFTDSLAFNGGFTGSGTIAPTGTFAPTGPVTLPTGATVGGYPVDATTKLVTVAAATTTLSLTAALHGNRFVSVGPTGGLAITLPAPTGTGVKFTIGVNTTVSGGNLTIDAKGGDASALFNGLAFQNKTGTGLTTTPVAANTNLITLNGTTTGGVLGDLVEIVDVGTHSWNLLINGQYTGTFATPFSNH